MEKVDSTDLQREIGSYVRDQPYMQDQPSHTAVIIIMIIVIK